MIKTIVMAQGNIFIRELLRRKKLPIGTTKEDFEANLLDAVKSGDLLLADIKEWLEEVEGWGDQHIYLYKISTAISTDPVWNSPDSVRERLSGADQKLWNADSLVFPESLALTGISYGGRSLRYVWHQRLTTLLRRPNMDRKEKIDGDSYEFRAYLARPDRAVMRFVLHLDKGLAAVFMQIPVGGSAHHDALEMVKKASKPFFDWSLLTALSASDTIKNLDQAALENETTTKVRSKKTRLTDAGTYVEFASTTESEGYGQSEAVRSVRRAVKPERFAGNSGVFLYKARTPTQLERLRILVKSIRVPEGRRSAFRRIPIR